MSQPLRTTCRQCGQRITVERTKKGFRLHDPDGALHSCAVPCRACGKSILFEEDAKGRLVAMDPGGDPHRCWRPCQHCGTPIFFKSFGSKHVPCEDGDEPHACKAVKCSRCKLDITFRFDTRKRRWQATDPSTGDPHEC